MTSAISSLVFYSNNRTKKVNTETEETAVPDSTTTIEKEMTEFLLGQDVLLKQKDGRYYLGTVVEVNIEREQCLVKFGDNTQHWSSFRDLTKLSTPEQEDLLCVICKKSSPKDKNEITGCDKCGRGYHKRCHQPEIPEISEKDGTWICKRCSDSEPNRLRKSDVRSSRRDSLRSVASSNSDYQIATSSNAKVLPYDLSSLVWDTYHRVNAEQIYCYCGGNGEWYKQMLQCGRCRQWFHENCVDCLQYPLYCGDRFYVFVCSICNHGKEFLRRLEMKLVDLVHMMLFNLTVHHSKKYYDLDSVIIPYINDNWHALQLSLKISSISKPERREHILSVLTTNRNRFKCGREIKKRTTIWGLRVRLPPPAPCMTLPTSGRITEEELKDLWQSNRRLQMLPGPSIENSMVVVKKIVPIDGHMRNIMTGVGYQQNCAPSESDSPCPSPETVNEKSPIDEVDLKLGNYIGAGCVKKSVPFPKISLLKKKRLLALNSRERILRRPKRRNTSDGADRKQRKETGGRSYVTRLSLDSKNNKTNESLPLTPPTSVSAPPTPPASGSTSLMSDLSNDFLDTFNAPQKFKKSIGLEASLPDLSNNANCDTSGDETSSKSTLDLIIPPPKDFEGKNNPFLALLRGGGGQGEEKKKRGKDSITLPLPLTAVIPGKPPKGRPLKRQLSEKDIFIGPNGEVKRRRLRRNRSGSNIYNVPGQTASKTAAVVPIRPDIKEWSSSGNAQNGNSSEYSFSSRRFRPKPEKIQEKEKPSSNPTTPKPSPVKQEPDIDIDDLKSSVNIYFGAANRIAAGERFSVKAKRFSPSGKEEYLIEFEGPSNGMT